MSTPTPPPPPRTLQSHQLTALLLTFLAYASFHASRKAPSIVKSVLSAHWAPFNTPSGAHRLGELDLAFLSSYAAAMFFSGSLADRADLRLLLSLSMLASSLTTALFGLGYFLQFHELLFFLIVQIASGVVQSAGWPCVVAIVGNWFRKSSTRGLIMGLWNSHTSVGNIVGSVLAAAVVEFGWGWSFVMPALVIAGVSVFVSLFLVAHPSEAGFEVEEMEVEMNKEEENGGEEVGLLGGEEEEGKKAEVEMGVELPRAIGFLEAWRLPGVAPYAFCLFFSKLVAYTFLYWLPFYIRNNGGYSCITV